MLEKLSTKLRSIITANTLIQSVYDFEASNLEGSPAATLTPSANESYYSTTTENRRTYAFLLRLFTIRESGNNNEQTTEKAMRQLVDTVLNNLDNAHRLSGLDTQTGYSFLWLEATPSAWGYAGRENQYRVAEVNIRVHFDVDVNLVS